jgi:hypothetical protein
MERVRKFIVTHLWWMVLVVALAMLLGHSFGTKLFVVDNTSLILLALILISPFVAGIKKFKWGEFEAEIGTEEVQRVTQQVEESLPPAKPTPAPPIAGEESETVAAIKSLAASDPVVALAKLRIELESRLRRLYHRARPQNKAVKPGQPNLSLLIRDLVTQEDWGPGFGDSLLRVISICNRAIHGEDISNVDANRVVSIGGLLIEYLDSEIRHYGTYHPLEKKVISQADVDAFRDGRYELTTVIPLVEEPKQCVYLVTQDELDAFLNGYSTFAEFMVRLEKIDESS